MHVTYLVHVKIMVYVVLHNCIIVVYVVLYYVLCQRCPLVSATPRQRYLRQRSPPGQHSPPPVSAVALPTPVTAPPST